MTAYLIEPRLHVVLPLFMEVAIGDHVIPFGRHGGDLTNRNDRFKCEQYKCSGLDDKCRTTKSR